MKTYDCGLGVSVTIREAQHEFGVRTATIINSEACEAVSGGSD